MVDDRLESSEIPPPHAAVQGVVLAGVHAWGESVLERCICRPLVPIAARPLICHTLSWLRDAGVCEASVCANSDTIFLRRQLKDGRSLNINLDYYEDVMPRGPAGCARDVSVTSDADVFLIVEGTLLPKIDLKALLAAHESTGAVLTVVVAAAPGPASSSAPLLEPVGIYVFSRKALECVPSHGYQDIKEWLIPRLHACGERVRTYTVNRAATPSVTNLASYLAVSEWAVEQLVRQETPAGYVRRGEACVHVSARIHSTARLVGPVWVEPGCRLGANALIVGPATIGENCQIEDAAVISRSALWTGCAIGAAAVLDQCIVTDRGAVDAANTLRQQVVVPRTASGHMGLAILLRWLAHNRARRASTAWQGAGRNWLDAPVTGPATGGLGRTSFHPVPAGGRRARSSSSESDVTSPGAR